MTVVGESNFRRLRAQKQLLAAWRHIYNTGRTASLETQRSLAAFKQDEYSNIARICRELGGGTFDFGRARGAPVKRPGKKPRPIVIPTVAARVVQRALLDELQRLPELKIFFSSPHSFGGVVGRNRVEAIGAVQLALADAKHFLRSDICEFFTRIPRQLALRTLSAPLDGAAAALLDRATHLELENAGELRDLLSLFPTASLGAAQGLCLSPLMGNVVLHEFDARMNERGIRCIRYVDDFILLGPSERHVMAAFDSALQQLGALGMTAYDRRKEKEKSKAAHGPTTQAIDFLGCAVERGRVQPNRAARAKVVERVTDMLSNSESALSNPARAYSEQLTFSRTLYDVGNTLKGWRDSFAFCGPSEVFSNLDGTIDKLIENYLAGFRQNFARARAGERRLLLGVPLLSRSEEGGGR